MANSSMLVLPRMGIPAARSRVTTVASYGGTQPSRTLEPHVVGIPMVTRTSLTAIGTPARTWRSSPAARPEAAVPVKKSVTPDYIVCLEDGKKLKMLKRHLRTGYDMSPEQYRQRWALPADYPMVAPKYAEKRSKLAKAIGLGTQPRRKRAKKNGS